jgi:hypothetical protein
MPKKRKKKVSSETPSAVPDALEEEIKRASKGLWYVSETDGEIRLFAGRPAGAVTAENLLAQIGKDPGTPIEEKDFSKFFDRLTAIADWFGDEEKATAERFAELRRVLAANLRDLKVFKVGEIELDVYVVGLDQNGSLIGIRTKAVET